MLSLPLLCRLWQNARYRRLLSELLRGRPEAGLGLEELIPGPIAAAALGLLRLGELGRSALPIGRELRGRLLMSQNTDGSWGEGHQRPVLTALCIRGLSAVRAGGASGSLNGSRFGMIRIGFDAAPGESVERAIRRGVDWLARAQAADGSWNDDSLASAIVLLELGRLAEFRAAVRVSDALRVAGRTAGQAPQCARAWSRVELRCGRALRRAAMAQRGQPRRLSQELFAQVA